MLILHSDLIYKRNELVWRGGADSLHSRIKTMDDLIEIFKDLSTMKDLLASDEVSLEENERDPVADDLQPSVTDEDDSFLSSHDVDENSIDEQVFLTREENEENDNSSTADNISSYEDYEREHDRNEEENSSQEPESCTFFTVC